MIILTIKDKIESFCWGVTVGNGSVTADTSDKLPQSVIKDLEARWGRILSSEEEQYLRDEYRKNVQSVQSP